MPSFQTKWRSLSPIVGALMFLLGFPYICFMISLDRSKFILSEGHGASADKSDFSHHPPRNLIEASVQRIGPTLLDVLQANSVNGYLMGNLTHAKFLSYGHDVDLRIIVLTMDRADSLAKCLASINAGHYEAGSRVSLHIWVDRRPNNTVDSRVAQVAHQFNFSHGSYHVHLQPHHVGIQQQWVSTWRPHGATVEVAVVIEDDITVSPHFWRWLRSAHRAYDTHEDVSGYGLSHPGISHKYGTRLDIPDNTTVYKYRVLTTWGFSPRAATWRAFQDWFYRTDPAFQPLVPGILPTEWYISEARRGRGRDLWEMWHIYYTHQHSQYTVLLNSLDDGLLAVNRHERGLHDGAQGPGAREKVMAKWRRKYNFFPLTPPKYGYDGQVES